jgi:hypothetical protein
MEGDMTDVATPGASDRIAAIRAAMTEDAEAGATFAEPVRASIEAALTRLDTLSGAAPHAEAAALLDHVRDRISGLDPARLEPRRGLAGLFDSRGKRLKAFRAAYLSAADASASGAADLADRAAAIARRGEDLEGLWNGLRTGLSDLDDQLAAGRAWLTDRVAPPASTVPPEAAAAFEDMPETPVDGEPAQAEAEADATPAADAHEASDPAEPNAESEVAPAVAAPSEHPSPPEAEVITEVVETGLSEAPVQEAIAETVTAEPAETASDHATPDAEPVDRPAEVTNLPHPLEARLDALMELRTRAVGALPRVRALQNADHAVPAAVSSARDHIEAWRADWREAMGLSGKRPRKVRPGLSRLEQSKQALMLGLGAAERTLAATRSRLAELAPPTPVAEVQRAAA